jgi:hypothetical protein
MMTDTGKLAIDLRSSAFICGRCEIRRAGRIGRQGSSRADGGLSDSMMTDPGKLALGSAFICGPVFRRRNRYFLQIQLDTNLQTCDG